MSINVTVKNRKEEVICTLPKVEMGMTVQDFKKLFLKECDYAKKKKLYPERLRFTVNEARGTPLADHSKKMSTYIETPTVTLYFKDLGPQIGWDTVFYIEYAGPIVMTLALLAFRKSIYGKDTALTLNQKLGVFMVLLHYIKRELETAFVHRFSSATMPFTNVFKNSFHYFGLFGFLTMYFFLHPEYTPPAWASDGFYYAATAFFVLFEFLNLQTHLVLKNLRKPGTTERNIPHGWGFGMVSSANYLWESLAWITFCVQAQVIGGYVFLVASVYQMTVWAIKKHKRYR